MSHQFKPTVYSSVNFNRKRGKHRLDQLRLKQYSTSMHDYMQLYCWGWHVLDDIQKGIRFLLDKYLIGWHCTMSCIYLTNIKFGKSRSSLHYPPPFAFITHYMYKLEICLVPLSLHIASPAYYFDYVEHWNQLKVISMQRRRFNVSNVPVPSL